MKSIHAAFDCVLTYAQPRRAVLHQRVPARLPPRGHSRPLDRFIRFPTRYAGFIPTRWGKMSAFIKLTLPAVRQTRTKTVTSDGWIRPKLPFPTTVPAGPATRPTSGTVGRFSQVRIQGKTGDEAASHSGSTAQLLFCCRKL